MTTKTPAKKDSRSATPADAITLLTDDHKEIHALFRNYAELCERGADGAERGPLAEQICMLLTVHAAIEEEIFYPAAQAAEIGATLLDEAEVEHAGVKNLIAQIEAMDADDELYDAKLTVLGEYVDHHVKEEQDQMFPACRAAKMDLEGIGGELAARKAELMAEMSEGMEATH